VSTGHHTQTQSRRTRFAHSSNLIDARHGDTPLLELLLQCVDYGKRGHGIIVRGARIGNW
jgi:hypothetical protein